MYPLAFHTLNIETNGEETENEIPFEPKLKYHR